jgi:hypothetical protein
MTYLIKDNVAHFYNRENVEANVPNCKVLHTNSWVELLTTKVVGKVVNIPFPLNDEFKSL